MDRYWLITWTCYGNRLPGDERGFVGNVWEFNKRVIHNIPGTPHAADIPRLKAWVSERMTSPPVILARPEAEAMIAQYQETARIREWELQAASVMFNHTHIVVGVWGDPDPDAILQTFKSWATRAVKKIRPLPPNGSFWTLKGSARKLADEENIQAGVIYVVKRQPNPLAVWFAPEWQELLDAYAPES